MKAKHITDKMMILTKKSKKTVNQKRFAVFLLLKNEKIYNSFNLFNQF